MLAPCLGICPAGGGYRIGRTALSKRGVQLGSSRNAVSPIGGGSGRNATSKKDNRATGVTNSDVHDMGIRNSSVSLTRGTVDHVCGNRGFRNAGTAAPISLKRRYHLVTIYMVKQKLYTYMFTY